MKCNYLKNSSRINNLEFRIPPKRSYSDETLFKVWRNPWPLVYKAGGLSTALLSLFYVTMCSKPLLWWCWLTQYFSHIKITASQNHLVKECMQYHCIERKKVFYGISVQDHIFLESSFDITFTNLRICKPYWSKENDKVTSHHDLECLL